MATDIADIVKRVLVSAPGCPQPVAEEYLLLAAIEFCRRSKVWTAVMTAVDLESTDFPYAITPEAGAKVNKVLSVVVNGESPGLDAINIRDAEFTADDWRTETGIPRYFIEMPKGTITTIALPDTAMSFVATVAYEPDDAATDLPDALVDDWLTPIISGAVSMLCSMPGKPWSSGEMFNLHSKKFDAGINDAKRDLHLHHVLPALTTSPSPI